MSTKDFLIASIFCFQLIGCSENFLDAKIKEVNSGTYHVNGTQINLTYGFPWPSWGGEVVILSSDTSFIEFTVEIEYPPAKKDTVRFKGLEGANAGEYQAVRRMCAHPSCFADANLDGVELTFAFGSPGGTYTGTGLLGGGRLILETHFVYRSVGIDYFLEGRKIDD